MKKFLIAGLVCASLSAFATDVVPNEASFAGAKPLINTKFASMDSSNGVYSAAMNNQSVTNTAVGSFMTSQAATNKLIGVSITTSCFVTNNGGAPIFQMYFTNGVLGRVVLP